MEYHSYHIAPEVFERFPGYVRGVVVCYDLDNGASPDELVQMLRDAEASLRARGIAIEQIAEEPHIKAWRDAYRAFGAKPAEFRSSIEAMARRALRGDELPAITRLVDIGNIVSLRHLLPAGSHAIDVLKGDIELKFADGDEDFIPFGTNELEHPLPGEVVFVEGKQVLTRRWTWRQGNHTLTLPETRAVEFNVDGLPPVTREEVEAACKEVADLVTCWCGGTSRIDYLTAETPTVTLEP